MSPKVDFIDKVLARIDRLDRASVQTYVESLVRERKQIEEALDRVNEGVLLLDQGGIVKFANRRAFLWLGFERFFKDRTPIADLVEEPLVKRFILDRLKQPREAASDEFEVLVPREMSLKVHWTPLEADNAKDILLRIENTTDEKNRTRDEAQAQRIEGLIRLAAGVAHELGNPLNSIQIHLELLRREMTKFPKAKQGTFNKEIEVIDTETKRLDQMVRSFLRATRRPPVRFRKESLNGLLEESVDFLHPEMQKGKVRPRLTLAKNLPAFLLDRDRLRETFLNVLKNAMEAMPQGGEVRISTTFKEKLCFVRFEDEGEGIDEKHLPHIFEAYYTTKSEGSGLGLAQVYQAVREHGGRIDVKSQLGRGSIFTLILPIRLERLPLPQPK